MNRFYTFANVMLAKRNLPVAETYFEMALHRDASVPGARIQLRRIRCALLLHHHYMDVRMPVYACTYIR